MKVAHENQAAGSIRRLDKPYDGRIRQSAALLAAALLAGMVAPAGGADAPSTFTNPLLSSGPDPWITQVDGVRSEEHTSELQSLMRISYAVFCLKKQKHTTYYTYLDI